MVKEIAACIQGTGCFMKTDCGRTGLMEGKKTCVKRRSGKIIIKSLSCRLFLQVYFLQLEDDLFFTTESQSLSQLPSVRVLLLLLDASRIIIVLLSSIILPAQGKWLIVVFILHHQVNLSFLAFSSLFCCCYYCAKIALF